MTSEPLDLEPIRERVNARGTNDTSPWAGHDRIALLAEVDRLRDEVTDRANVEADLRAQLAEAKAELVKVQTHLDNMH